MPILSPEQAITFIFPLLFLQPKIYGIQYVSLLCSAQICLHIMSNLCLLYCVSSALVAQEDNLSLFIRASFNCISVSPCSSLTVFPQQTSALYRSSAQYPILHMFTAQTSESSMRALDILLCTKDLSSGFPRRWGDLRHPFVLQWKCIVRSAAICYAIFLLHTQCSKPVS